jgi:hypothetical protein
MKRVVPILLVGVLLISSVGAAVSNNNQRKTTSFQEEMRFSEPMLTTQEGYLSVQIPEATSSIAAPGDPLLPVYTKQFTFPFGTIITNVSFSASSEQTIRLSKEIIPVDIPSPVTQQSIQTSSEKHVKNDEVYSGVGSYPSSRLRYQVGAGLVGNTHVMILSVQYFPLLYLPVKRTLLFTPDVQITVTYEPPQDTETLSSNTSLLIIAPEEFSTALQPLLLHKNQVGMQTTLVTTEWIGTHSTGRDLQEQIKYTIKDAIEVNGVSFVLLVGGVDKLPVRQSYTQLWDWDENLITDLYYSDIYDSSAGFSSWDTNGNNRFGESTDTLDLYPDVHLGRLACASLTDVNLVVDKIIHYEAETYGHDWFDTMIFVGGNTFPWSQGNDGEQNNEIIMGIMSQFTPKIIWTSKDNFSRRTISAAITEGAGFLDYSGHGVENGLMTYTPNGLGKKYYFTPYIKDLQNGYKLPIIFFDACLTAKIDFVIQDLLDYRAYWFFDILSRLFRVNTSEMLDCHAWAYVNHENGGAIATIGATRTAYGGIDSGAGKMSIEFFSAYSESEYLGQMMTQMQTAYISEVFNDAFTVEEFMLLGDPSLRLGGYPPQ